MATFLCDGGGGQHGGAVASQQEDPGFTTLCVCVCACVWVGVWVIKEDIRGKRKKMQLNEKFIYYQKQIKYI